MVIRYNFGTARYIQIYCFLVYNMHMFSYNSYSQFIFIHTVHTYSKKSVCGQWQNKKQWATLHYRHHILRLLDSWKEPFKTTVSEATIDTRQKSDISNYSTMGYENFPRGGNDPHAPIFILVCATHGLTGLLSYG